MIIIIIIFIIVIIIVNNNNIINNNKDPTKLKIDLVSNIWAALADKIIDPEAPGIITIITIIMIITNITIQL